MVAIINAPNLGGGHTIHLQVGGNDMATLSSTGVLSLTGSAPKVQYGSISIIDVSAGTDMKLNAPNVGGGHKIYFQVGGTNVMSVDSSGNVRALGTFTTGTP